MLTISNRISLFFFGPSTVQKMRRAQLERAASEAWNENDMDTYSILCYWIFEWDHICAHPLTYGF